VGSHLVFNVLTWSFLGLVAGDWVAYATGRRKLSGALGLASDTVYAGFVVWCVVNRQWVNAAIGVAVLVFIFWWTGRRKRRQAPRSLGAKSKALRDAIVRRVRELRPSPVRVPVPVREGP
jgi:membrane protein DedA with SNARE-associated domain